MESVSLLTKLWSKLLDSKFAKEARMTKRIRINYIFWKEGPLLPRLPGSTQLFL
jgi:hypothetical protein